MFAWVFAWVSACWVSAVPAALLLIAVCSRKLWYLQGQLHVAVCLTVAPWCVSLGICWVVWCQLLLQQRPWLQVVASNPVILHTGGCMLLYADEVPTTSPQRPYRCVLHASLLVIAAPTALLRACTLQTHVARHFAATFLDRCCTGCCCCLRNAQTSLLQTQPYPVLVACMWPDDSRVPLQS
jgi:hypothetical protein